MSFCWIHGEARAKYRQCSKPSRSSGCKKGRIKNSQEKERETFCLKAINKTLQQHASPSSGCIFCALFVLGQCFPSRWQHPPQQCKAGWCGVLPGSCLSSSRGCLSISCSSKATVSLLSHVWALPFALEAQTDVEAQADMKAW